MRILIITNNFVREVSYLVRYATQADPSLQFSVLIPDHAVMEEPLPAAVAKRKVFFSHHIRMACYSPGLIAEIHACRPEILHVFEEFSGLIAFQAVFFKNLVWRKSKTMVYSAENIQGNVGAVFWAPMKYVANRADLAFVCSQSVKRVLKSEGFSNPIEVFPLGVDTAKFHKFPVNQLKTQLNLDGKFVIGYVGRLLEIKGVFLLIEMMRELPEHVQILMIGTGAEEKKLWRKVVTDHLEQRVHLLGSVPYEQLPQYMNCMDVGIIPSKTSKRWKEQFGRVVVELMSCEVPVIGSASGSIPEILGETGWLFHENAVQELTNIVKMLIAHREKRQEAGTRGRARAIARYSTETMGARFLAIYQKLTSGSGGQMRERSQDMGT